MKKQIAAIILITGLAVTTVTSASWGRGGQGYGGDGNCPQMQMPMMQPMDQATQEKVTKFFKDNQALHKQIVMKQAEKHALMRSEKPDPQTAAKIAGELFDLQTSMHDKAEAAGVAQYVGPMGRGMGMRGHQGFGGARPGMMNPDPGKMAPNSPQQ